ncbi:MAG: flagellin [Comamonas sp.]
MEQTGFAAAPQLDASNKPTNGGGYANYRLELQAQANALLNAGAAAVTVGNLANDTFTDAEALVGATATAIANSNMALYTTATSAGTFGLTGAVLVRDDQGEVTATTAAAGADLDAMFVALGGAAGSIWDTSLNSGAGGFTAAVTNAAGALAAVVAQAKNTTSTPTGDALAFQTWVKEAPPANAAAIEAQLTGPNPDDAKFDGTQFDLDDLVSDVRVKSGVLDASIEDIFGADQTWVDTTTTPATPTWKTGLTGDEAVAAFKAAEMFVASQKGLGIVEADVKTSVSLDELDITTQADAWTALKVIDTAIDQVNSARADLGALQTRFEKSIENIDIQSENINAARGRIVDADFASETAALSRSQILQQAGTAMVAQANQLPQNVLSLLR